MYGVTILRIRQKKSMVEEVYELKDIEPKINVLLVMDHLGYNAKQIHGVAKYFLNLVPNIGQDFNLVPCILRNKDDLDKHFREKGIDVLYLGRKKFDPRQLFDLIAIIRKLKINLLHLQGFGSSTIGRIAGILTKVPVIVHQRDADPEYPRYMVIADWILARFTSFGLSVSDYARKFLSETRKVPLHKIVSMINPIDIEKLREIEEGEIECVKRSLNYDPNVRYVGSITRCFPIKGVEIFIKAIQLIISQYDMVKFVICGDGPLLDDMKQLSVELGVADYVVFMGFVDKPELWLSVFDIVVVTSYSEGCSNAALEAMGLGKAIVCTKCGGPEEFLENDYSAILVEPGDVEGTARSILKLLHDSNMREKIATNAAKSAEKYNLRNHIDKIETIYKNVIDWSVT